MRTFIIGDIHGCFDELIALTQKLGLTDEDLLVSVGDIVDRGNKSKEVYEYFLNRPNSKVLIGNHERKHQNGVLSYSQQIVKVQFGDVYNDFLQWIATLDYFYETDEAIIVHAFFEHDKALPTQRQEVLCGSTSGEKYLEKKYREGTYWYEYYEGLKPIIYGHHVVGDSPRVFQNTYGLDTGCCHGNYLTALELPGFKIHQVKAKKDYWLDEQKIWQIPVLKAKDWSQMRFIDIDKQIDKLAHLTDPEAVSFLSEIKNWKIHLQNTYTLIKEAIEALCAQLLNADLEHFNQKANQYPCSTYLFKSRANNLTRDDLSTGLNTPRKIIEIAKLLKIDTAMGNNLELFSASCADK